MTGSMLRITPKNIRQIIQSYMYFTAELDKVEYFCNAKSDKR
jgi:hypothetical protein